MHFLFHQFLMLIQRVIKHVFSSIFACYCWKQQKWFSDQEILVCILSSYHWNCETTACRRIRPYSIYSVKVCRHSLTFRILCKCRWKEKGPSSWTSKCAFIHPGYYTFHILHAHKSSNIYKHNPEHRAPTQFSTANTIINLWFRFTDF